MRVTSTRDSRRQNFRGDFDDLLRRFAAAKNDFGKTLAERAVRVHLREAEVGHGRGLKRAQNLVAAHSARAEFFQQLNRFGNGHSTVMTDATANARPVKSRTKFNGDAGTAVPGFCSKIPDDEHIQRQHDGQSNFGMSEIMPVGAWPDAFRPVMAHQFKNFNRDEKRRLANRQPDGPFRAKRQPQALRR